MNFNCIKIVHLGWRKLKFTYIKNQKFRTLIFRTFKFRTKNFGQKIALISDFRTNISDKMNFAVEFRTFLSHFGQIYISPINVENYASIRFRAINYDKFKPITLIFYKKLPQLRAIKVS